MGTHSIVVCLILGLNTFGFSNTAEKKEFCTTPDLKDGYIHRDPPTKDSIYYSCKTGYKPFFGNWWGAAKCNNGLWLNEPQCIQKEECGVLPSLQHGQIKKTNAGQTAEIVCDPGFKSLKESIRCNNGRWETPTCEVDELSCVSPTRVENAVIISKPQERYLSGTHVTYKCHRNFTINGKRDVFCTNSAWDKAPTCEAFCPKPLQIVSNAILTETNDGRKHSHGDTLRYECVDGYETKGETSAKCDGQTWIYPKCIKKSQCTKPTKNVRFVTLLDDRNIFNNFDVLKYKCNKPYDKIPEGTLTCKDEKWIGTIDCTSSICPIPPLIEDGDYSILDRIGEIITEVSYSCQSYYVLNKQKRFYSCQGGRWEMPPRCLKPCKFTPEIYQEYNIQPVPYDYIQHSDEETELDCKKGWNVGNWKRSEYVNVKCSDGKITIDNKCNTKNYFSG